MGRSFLASSTSLASSMPSDRKYSKGGSHMVLKKSSVLPPTPIPRATGIPRPTKTRSVLPSGSTLESGSASPFPFSRTRTLWPRMASSRASVPPAAPEPTTMAS